ncbi:LytTR family DNA-binding domain-containing protein [uncultured Draconibacterium sp.]|uniref:LytTR family DNA-binding domain-containing protein n=1 Tax=uncultured Draconibacterium sp. TaxID=1573823 RepID=UPI0029C97478|nr:LytTR family DNA-binding domain-containing protein [uncultured Draconibacterium sp.]
MGFSFVRTHTSHLANLKHVVAYSKTDGGTLELSNGDRILISRRRKDEVLKMLKTAIA